MPTALTVQDAKKIIKGKLIQGDLSTRITGVSIDSRTIKKGNVFIAIKGERFDGHHFIRTAIRKGAAAVVASKRVACPGYATVIYVQDTTKALGQMAAWHRRQFDIPVIAITGSAGKTTAKEMIASVLKTQYKVLKNTKTENNQFGVPLTLLKLNTSYQVAILELGTNQPGDIRWLAQITRPKIAVLTNIGESHLKGLKSQRGVFREKIQLIKHMEPRASVIFNGDDRYLRSILKQRGIRKKICFGCGPHVDCRADRITMENNRRLRFRARGRTWIINSPAAHNVYNALAAISCGLACKIRYNNIITALARFKFHGSRQEIRKIGRLWLIDDTYNANPISFKSAIDTLDALRINGKRIIVCSDMLELGAKSRTLHRSVGKMMAQSAVDMVLTTGRHARCITQSLNQSDGNIKAVHCNSLKEVHRRLKGFCRPGDAVLVKGSRGMRMERTVQFLEKEFSG